MKINLNYFLSFLIFCFLALILSCNSSQLPTEEKLNPTIKNTILSNDFEWIHDSVKIKHKRIQLNQILIEGTLAIKNNLTDKKNVEITVFKHNFTTEKRKRFLVKDIVFRIDLLPQQINEITFKDTIDCFADNKKQWISGGLSKVKYYTIRILN